MFVHNYIMVYVIGDKLHYFLFQNCESLLSTALDEKFHPAIKEISVYLVESVGNSTRIDYGTGSHLQLSNGILLAYSHMKYIRVCI